MWLALFRVTKLLVFDQKWPSDTSILIIILKWSNSWFWKYFWELLTHSFSPQWFFFCTVTHQPASHVSLNPTPCLTAAQSSNQSPSIPSLYHKTTRVRKSGKTSYLPFSFVLEREDEEERKRNRIASNIQFSPAAAAFINANALSRGAWHTQANSLCSTHTHTATDAQTQTHTHTAGGWCSAHQCHCCRAPRCTNHSRSADDGRKRMLT